MTQVYLNKNWEDTANSKPIILKKDGSWLHGETPITNEKVISYFYSLIYKTDDEYWLINEREKERLIVEDTPYLVKRVIFFEVDSELHAELLLKHELRIPFVLSNFYIRSDGEWIIDFPSPNQKNVKIAARMLPSAKRDIVKECEPTENENFIAFQIGNEKILLPVT